MVVDSNITYFRPSVRTQVCVCVYVCGVIKYPNKDLEQRRYLLFAVLSSPC